jgi:hypothetical protein
MADTRPYVMLMGHFKTGRQFSKSHAPFCCEQDLFSPAENVLNGFFGDESAEELHAVG